MREELANALGFLAINRDNALTVLRSEISDSSQAEVTEVHALASFDRKVCGR
jgi:hypothetical protein